MPGGVHATVCYVFDGDTIEVETADGQALRIRLLGIDAPEIDHEKYGKMGDPYGEEAAKALGKLVNARTVFLEFDEKRYDQYGRTLAYVWMSDGQMANEAMVKQGLARSLFYKPNLRYRSRIEDAERAAKASRLGLWLDGDGATKNILARLVCWGTSAA